MLQRPNSVMSKGNQEWHDLWDRIEQCPVPVVIPPDPFYCFRRMGIDGNEVLIGMMDRVPMLTPPVVSLVFKFVTEF
jgi:hypothetical protein